MNIEKKKIAVCCAVEIRIGIDKVNEVFCEFRAEYPEEIVVDGEAFVFKDFFPDLKERK